MRTEEGNKENEEEEGDFVWFCQHCRLVSRSGWADINAQPTHPLQPDHLVLTIVNADKYGSPNPRISLFLGWSIMIDSFGALSLGSILSNMVHMIMVHIVHGLL